MSKALSFALSLLESSLALIDHLPCLSVLHTSFQNSGQVVLVWSILCLSIHKQRELVVNGSSETEAIILKALPNAGLRKYFDGIKESFGPHVFCLESHFLEAKTTRHLGGIKVV
ncbi:hypothetical protein DSO57_1013252 [Entomophthora muscae]|uniref:Uncharacterized protein n=1 Tax=Entomophthora muscae TaxID=34485 RepID=A0ACC2SJ58_9FUNG|nr:hypothetical protein DSO57_1013252 [Entomophthora muscae]